MCVLRRGLGLCIEVCPEEWSGFSKLAHVHSLHISFPFWMGTNSAKPLTGHPPPPGISDFPQKSIISIPSLQILHFMVQLKQDQGLVPFLEGTGQTEAGKALADILAVTCASRMFAEAV